MNETPAWMEYGACVGGKTDTFFPAEGQNATQAKRVCATCPVREPCLEYALSKREFGIWGGTTEEERITLRRKRARARQEGSHSRTRHHCERCNAFVPNGEHLCPRCEGDGRRRRHVPAEPFVEYVLGKGGPTAFGWSRFNPEMRTPLRRFHHAKRRGWLTFDAARVVAESVGVEPCELWPEWFEMEDEVA